MARDLFALCLAVGLTLTFAAAPGHAGQEIAGWIFPGDEDLKGDWLEYREQIPRPYFAEGDFNGDGGEGSPAVRRIL